MKKTLNVYALLTTQHKEENSRSAELQYDSRLDIEGFEAVGGEFKGSVKEVTCPNCRNRIQYIKQLR